MSAEEVLVLSRVGKTFRAGVAGCAASLDVLSDVSLTVRAGELTTVEGPRGAGKTTLLMCAAGLLRPDRGAVQWPALASRAERPPSGIAYAAERTTMYGFLTVRESLAYGRAVRKPYEAGAEDGVDALMDLAGLTTAADVRVGLLSPSARAHLIVALALVSSPRLLLVDDLCGATRSEPRETLARTLSDVAASGIGVVWAFRAGEAAFHAMYALADGKLASARLPARGLRMPCIPRTTSTAWKQDHPGL